MTNYRLENIETVDSPALVVFLEQVQANIEAAIEMVGDVSRLRPHVKTNKSGEAVRLMMQAGIYKFKCATIAEAELLGMSGATDALLAYQPVGPKAQRFAEVIRKFPATAFACLVDDAQAAEAMAAVFWEQGLEVSVFIDVNTGQNRTGIFPEKALALYSFCNELNGLHPVGIHAYDGHLRDADFTERKTKCDACFEVVNALRHSILAAGFPSPVIVAGGSPTLPIHAQRQAVECSPGTFIYWDKGYADLCPEQPFQPAAILVTRVISLPDETKICLDLGHKSVAAENPISNRVYFPEYPGLMAVSQSEEHLVMDAGKNHAFRVGDVLYGVPMHICPTVALYEVTYLAKGNQVADIWKTTARDRKITC